MRLFLLYLLILGFVPVSASASPDDQAVEASVLGGVSVIGTSSADIIMARSMVNPLHLKGDAAEYLVDSVLRQNNGSGWRPITSRFGRQGLDSIYVRYDLYGRPKALMVGEVKYGQSTLGMTKDGQQMSSRWINKRLIALSNRFEEAATSSDVRARSISGGRQPAHRIDVTLPNGHQGMFWRENALHSWKYQGKVSDLTEARKKVMTDAAFLRTAGLGRITIRKRIFDVKMTQDQVEITTRDAALLDQGISHKKLPGKIIRLPLGEMNIASNQALADKLARKIPVLSAADAKLLANKVNRRFEYQMASNRFTQFGHSASKLKAISALKAGSFGALIAGGFDIYQNHSEGNLFRSSMMGLWPVAVGTYTGNTLIPAIINSRRVAASAAFLGTSPMELSKVIGMGSGFATTSIIAGYTCYALGDCSLGTANMIAGSGVASGVAGSLAASGTMLAISSFASAGTGTAISSLSGVAATNASLAWLGMGGGMATGGMVLGGIVTTGAIATYYLVDWGTNQWERKKIHDKMMEMLRSYPEMEHSI